VPTPLALGRRRLVVVTGKGGVGKSSVAAALSRAAAGAGRRVLAVDVDAAGVADFLGCPEASSEPTSIASGLAVARIDARTALRDVVHGIMPLAILARRLLDSTTFQVLAAAAPGLPEYLVLTKIAGWFEATRLGRHRWDLVVVDAPASGHSLPLLTAPRSLAALARLGPLGRALARLESTFTNAEETALWLVTLPEALPVLETIELHEALAHAGLPVATPVVNAMPRRRFTAAEARVVESSGVDATHPMITCARLELARRRDALGHLATLERAVGAAAVTLPYQPADPSADDFSTLCSAIGRATGLLA